MKIGPLNISFAESKLKKPEQTELGATGTTAFNGSLVGEEYNRDLQGSKGIVIYDKMRRSDARVKFALLVCELPLRAATWSIEPASEDAKDVEIAETLQTNLFEQMTITWDSFLHHTLLMLPFGFMPFEKVWEIVDGQVRYRKLAPRLPKTLSKWLFDTNGGLAGIEQYVWINDTYKSITIPADKLLVFTNEKEGSNFEGVSILRTAYKHWYYKDNLYRIDGIAAERHAVGIPKFTHPTSADPASKANIDSMGQRMYAQEQQYVRLAEGYDMTIEGLTGTIRDIMPSINHHDRKIAESVLADFIDLGSSDRGSWALSKDKSSFFLMSLNSVATNICDTFNNYAVKPWVDYNYPNVEKYPKLKCGNLETREFQNYATAVTGLLQAGGITPDIELENALRDIAKLPAKAKEDYVKPSLNPTSQPVKQKEKQFFAAVELPKKPRRQLTKAEAHVRFDEIAKRLDESEITLASEAKRVAKKQTDKLVEVAVRLLEKKQLTKMDDIDVPFKAELVEAIEDQLWSLFEYGRSQVVTELSSQSQRQMTAKNSDDIWAKEFIRTRAKATTNLLANKLKTAVTIEGLRQFRRGTADRQAIDNVLTSISDKDLTTAAQFSAAEAFNFGRSQGAITFKDDIARVQYSALLDNNTCDICRPLDGEEWEPDDPRTEKYAQGNPDCLGGSRCRCLLVYIYGDEVIGGSGSYNISPAEDFKKSVEQNKRLPFLTDYSIEELKSFSTYLSRDGKTGFAITPDQELVNIFNNGVHGAGSKAIDRAILLGANHLDCFDGPLVAIYARFGFKEYKRMQWNDLFAPKNWDYATYGKPDIVYMRIDK